MDNSVYRYKCRRAARLAMRSEKRFDSVEAYRMRRYLRMQERFDASARLAYGIAKGMGINTEGMEPKEVWEAIRKKDPGAAKAALRGYGNRSPRGSASGQEKVRAKQTSRNMYQGTFKPPKVKGMSPAEVNQTLSACSKISNDHYSKGTEVANQRPALRTFTTHGIDHIQQVMEKTNQAADAIERINGHHFQGAPVDRKLMMVAAWFHDTGMDGGDADWGDDNGDGIRGSHGVNSALHILEHAKEIQEIGVNPAQAAFIAFAHTKSKSGINDLMNPKDWEEGLSKLEGAVNEYNERNPDKQIQFDRDSVFGGKPNNDNIHEMASQVAAVRLGDANREANIPLRSQTGGKYNIDKLGGPEDVKKQYEKMHAENPKYTMKDAEIDCAKISIEDDNGHHDLDDDNDEFTGVLPGSSRRYSKMVVLGERNMVKVDSAYNEKHGTLQEEVTLRNGNSAPECTVETLLERCGELNTINGIPRAIKVKMTGVNSINDLTEDARNAYTKMWERIQSDTDKNGNFKYKGVGHLVLEFEDGTKVRVGGNNSNEKNNRG